MSNLNYTWNDLDRDIDFLHDLVCVSFDMTLPTLVLGVKRGGLIPAVMLSHSLSCPLSVINYQTRDSDDEQPLFNVEDINQYQNIIVVDDLYDTGKTLDNIKEILDTTFPEKSIEFFVLLTNDDCKADYINSTGLLKPQSQWVIFPWE